MLTEIKPKDVAAHPRVEPGIMQDELPLHARRNLGSTA